YPNFVCQGPRAPRDLHSFPTRRSSDLDREADVAHGGHVAVALGHVRELDARGATVRRHPTRPAGGGTAAPTARRRIRRSPTRSWMSPIAASISAISTEL